VDPVAAGKRHAGPVAGKRHEDVAAGAVARDRVTDAHLRAFRVWLEDQGLAATTAEMYVHDARSAAEIGFVARLRVDQAPKTLHRIRAVGRQWARFRSDDALELALKKFKLPPARRQSVRIPLERAKLFAIVDELARADYLASPMRATIGLMACRGFRVGDVLRMQRSELIEAVQTGVLSYLGKGRKRIQFRLMPYWEAHVKHLAEIDGAWVRVEDLIAPTSDAKQRRKTASKAAQRALLELASHCGIAKVYPHRLRRTYAVEYLRQHGGDPEAVIKLKQHMQWADESTALQYVDHARGPELDEAGARIFER
jgi:integrase